MGPFFIVNSSYVENEGGELFDPTYINGVEDFDFLTRVLQRGRIRTIKADIEHIGGATLQNTSVRMWRNYANYVYFNYKIENGDLKVPNVRLNGADILANI